jgi:DNA-directed RNA polymerase sigma subunit (sigma70/sigma32)
MNDKSFKIGMHRRFYNKLLKDELEKKNLSYKKVCKKIKISAVQMSQIVNFRFNPSEDTRIKIACLLKIPIEHIFPEKYDEIYDRISPVQRDAEIEIKLLAIDSSEVLSLESHDDSEEIINNTDQGLLKKYVGQLLEGLPERDEAVIRYRFGIDDDTPRTLEEAGKKFGVTRERLRQIEAKAIDRIRTSISPKVGDEEMATKIASFL